MRYLHVDVTVEKLQQFQVMWDNIYVSVVPATIMNITFFVHKGSFINILRVAIFAAGCKIVSQ